MTKEKPIKVVRFEDATGKLHIFEFPEKMKRFLNIAWSPKTLRDFLNLCEELKCNPENFARKLREKVWKGKGLDEIDKELRK